jgi:AcrR family transcriptional regulator
MQVWDDDRVSDTVSRLRAAAEGLLLEKGQAATTLRDITDRAGANVASVSYHFGSKDALLTEVFRDVLLEATSVQQARLEALPDDATLEDVVRAWLSPALPSPDRDPREARLWAIVQRGMAEPSPGAAGHMAAVRPVVEEHLVTRLAARLPHLGPEELLVRHAATLAAVSVLATRGLDGMLGEAPSDRFADLVVAWIVGGLQAPAAG